MLIQEELEYICKTQIDVQSLIDVQSSNPCPISTSQKSVPQIYVLFSNSQIGVQWHHWHMLQITSHLLGQIFEAIMEKRQDQIPDEGFLMTKKKK